MKQYLRLLLVFCGVFFAAKASAQQSGFLIENHLPKEYRGFNQLWHLAQDKNGLLYFGGTSEVLVYDGQTWEHVPVKKGAATRQVLYDSVSATVYVGAVSEFGYLKRGGNGKLLFVTLTDQLNRQQKEFADVWKIYAINGSIYFQSSERICIFRDKKLTGVIEPEEKEKTFALSFACGGRLYVRQRNVGLMEVNGTRLVPVPGGERFASERIMGMLPWTGGRSLILSGDAGFYAMSGRPDASGKRVSAAPVISDNYLVNAFVLGCIIVNDSTIAVNSREGIGFYSMDGRAKEKINKASGLANGSVAALFLDRDKNVWAMHNNGTTRITYNSSIRIFDDRIAFDGSLETMNSFRGDYIFSTSEGIFVQRTDRLRKDMGVLLEPLGILQTEVWNTKEFQGDLLLATSSGLLKMSGKDFVSITDRNANGIYDLPGSENELLLVEKGSICFVRRETNGSYRLLHRYEFPAEEMMRCGPVHAVPGKEGVYEFWVPTRFKNVYHIQAGTRDSFLIRQSYDSTSGLPLDEYYPAVVDGNVCMLSLEHVYRYEPARDKGPGSRCFVEAPDIVSRFFKGGEVNMEPHLDPHFMMQSLKSVNACFFGVKNGKVRTALMNIGPEFDYDGIQGALLEPDDNLWVMSNDKLILTNVSRKVDIAMKFQALIRKVIIGKDSALVEGTDQAQLSLENDLPYKFNSVTFNYAAPFFWMNGKNHYVYKLEGYDTAWSKQTEVTSKDYTNLSEGTYTFRVYAISRTNSRSEEASFTFTILPPWYRATWAYAVYVVLLITLIYVIVRISIRRLQQAKVHLEKMVNERTAEVVEQKQQIENQKSQLETVLKDLSDSIHYAKRIQEAILPIDEQIAAAFEENFVLLYPRDIVSGDFHWFALRNDKIIIVCADCTGHGVPGALMSMIGNTLLNEIVMEGGISDPGRILEQLHLRVRQSLKQDINNDTRDGMDVSICVINNKTNRMQYAGANRPVFIFSNGQYTELSPDKYSIGGYQGEEDRRFTTHQIDIKAGDRVYMFSDGYPDQFGGDKGKKFMIKRFREMLMSIHTLPMDQQFQILENKFQEWKQDHEQTDDVLVIGFRY